MLLRFFLIPFFLLVNQGCFAESWSTPQVISNKGVFPYSSSLALDPQGNAVCVYVRLQFKDPEETMLRWVEASVKLAGGDWSEPIPLSAQTPAKFGIISPLVKVDNDGNAIALWNFPAGTKDDPWEKELIQCATLPFGSAQWIVQPFALASDTNIEAGPYFSLDKNGNALAVWGSWKDGNYTIESARLQKGNISWKDNTAIAVPYQFTSLYMHMNDLGQAWLIWSKGNFLYGENVLLSTLNPGATKWSDQETLVDGHGTTYYPYPRIISDPQGNMLTSWQEYQFGSEQGLKFAIKQLLKGSKTWKPTDFKNVETHIYTRGWLTLDPRGNALFIWYPDDNMLLSSSLLSGQSKWSDPLQISSENLSFQGSMDSHGNRLLMWYNWNEKLLKSSTLPAGTTTWTSPVVIGSYDLLNSQMSDAGPLVTFNESENFAMSLKSIDGTFP